MTGFEQDMTRLAGEIRDSHRERTRNDARRAPEMKAFLQKTRTERQLREQQEHQRLKDFTRARMRESAALKDALVQFVNTNRSQVHGMLGRLRTDFQAGARAFWAGLGHASMTPSMAFPADNKAATEDKRALGKRGMRTKD